MKKTLFTVPIMVLAVLFIFSGTVIAHEGEDHGEKRYEEGSGSSAMEMDRKSRAHAHEYKDEHGDAMGHSKDHYENKKHELQEEGSGMKEEARRMKEKMEHQRKEEGSH